MEQFGEESVAFKATAGLRREINPRDFRFKPRLMTVAQLVEHYRQRELTPENEWKTHSTRVTYKGYLSKWIVPRWGKQTWPE